jgi:anti-sigma B factor antagonist
MPACKIEIDKLPGGTDALAVFRPRGKLNLETVNEFIQTLRPEPAQHLILDMGGVTFLDSAGVGALVSLFVNRRNHSKTFALARLAPQSTAVVTVAGLQNLLPIHKTLEDALANKPLLGPDLSSGITSGTRPDDC